MESIGIGNDCFESVQTFQIDGLNRLKTLKIGSNSFTQKKKREGNDESKSFHIFSDFAGDFELKNLPQLKSIQIGKEYSDTYNFCYSSFVLRGIDVIWNMG